MTREDAIYYLQSSGFSDEQISTIEQAFKQEPCDDAISREDATAEFIKWQTEVAYAFGRDYLGVRIIQSAIDTIRELPPVTQKSGKWIAVYQGDEIINYRCSECELGDTNGSTNLYGWDYCRRCGAKMVEPQESEG